MPANERQVGGDHYKIGGEEHWDRIWRLYGRGYFIGCITKYVERYPQKGGMQDLEKAQHFLQKLIELEKSKTPVAWDKINQAGRLEIAEEPTPAASVDDDGICGKLVPQLRTLCTMSRGHPGGCMSCGLRVTGKGFCGLFQGHEGPCEVTPLSP